MANLNISGNTNGIVTAQIILVLREKSDLLTIVFQQAFLSNTQFNITVMDLNPVMHQVEVWTTNDGTTLDALKCTYDADVAQASGSGSFAYIQFKVGSGVVTGTGITTAGTAPVDGASQYIDTALDGLNYLVSKGGYGILQWGIEIQAVAGGGFEYIDGQKFSDLDEYTLIVANSNPGSGTSSSTKELTDVIIHTADATLTATHRNKLNVFNFAGNVAVLTMEALASVTDKTVYAFSTHRGAQINGEIKFQSGEGCYFRGGLQNQIFLGKNETIKMMVKSGACYAVEYSGWYDRVGERVMLDKLDVVNTLAMNNPATEYDGLIYKRIYAFILNDLSAGQKVTYAQYDNILVDTVNGANVFNNRGKYAVDIVNNKFKLPDMRDYTPKAVASGRASGSYEGWQVGGHFHDSGTEANPSNPNFLRAFVAKAVRAWTGGASTSTQAASTDLNNHSTAKALITDENKVKNIGYYPCVII